MSDTIMARTEFAVALNQISNERGISPETIINSIKTALVAAFRKDYPTEYEQAEEKGLVIEAVLDPETGEFRIISGEEGAKDKDKKDITPHGFGRIAAMTAKQVVMQ